MPDSDFRFSIAVAGYGRSGGYVVGKPVRITCTIENTGKTDREIFLADHDDYHGTLPYPTSMKASVWDSAGTPLVEGCSQYDAWSTMFKEMPGDRIRLKPGAKMVRVVSLDDIIILRVAKLSAGTYRVQLKLPEATSNMLEIVLKAEPDPNIPSVPVGGPQR